MVLAEKNRAILASEASPIAYVEAKKHWTVVLQIGASNRWREFGGGRWVLDRFEEVDAPDMKSKIRKNFWQHRPAIHEAGPLDSRTVNGLIGEHNSWVMHNAACGQRPRMRDDDGRVNHDLLAGQVARQLLVVSVEECDPPEDAVQTARTREISASVEATIRALVASGVLSAPTPVAASKGK